VGTMGCSGTHMDLTMVKQEQGETLHKYMRRFFNKRATVVDVTDKEVIDHFQALPPPHLRRFRSLPPEFHH
jgi:hypothetical protein